MIVTRELLEFFFGSILLLIVFIQFSYSLKNIQNISLIDIAIWMTGTAFGLAPFVLYFYGGKFPEDKLLNVFLSYLGIILFISALLIIKKFFKKIIKKNKNLISILIKVNNINPKHILILYLIYLFVRAVFAFEYGIFGSGSSTLDRIQSVPYYLFILQSFFGLVFWGCIFWSFVKILYNKKLTLLPTFILISGALLVFFMGRRQVLYFVFLYMYVYILLGYKINYKVLFTALATIIILINVIFPYFLSLRNLTLNSENNFDLLENYLYAFNILSHEGIDKYIFEKNIIERVYINYWNIKIISKSSLFDGLNGLAILSSIMWGVPRFFLPYKSVLMDPESMINYNFGLNRVDSPSNWPGFGFADFGLLGSFLYGLLFGLILFLMQLFAYFNLKKFPFLSLIIIATFALLAFLVEESPIGAFTAIRDIISLYFIFNFFYLFRSKKSKILCK